MWAAGIDSRRQGSMDVVASTERTALLTRRHSMVDTTELDDDEDDRMKSESSGPVAGGTVLGVHNLAIVFPQFVVSSNTRTGTKSGVESVKRAFEKRRRSLRLSSSLPAEADNPSSLHGILILTLFPLAFIPRLPSSPP
jgi:hypothetical protein